MLLVSLSAGARAVSPPTRGLRSDAARQAAFGLPGCADQSVIGGALWASLDAATPEDVAALRAAIDALTIRFRRARRHDHSAALLVLDVDLAPLPASRKAEGSAAEGIPRLLGQVVVDHASFYGSSSVQIAYLPCAPGSLQCLTGNALQLVE